MSTKCETVLYPEEYARVSTGKQPFIVLDKFGYVDTKALFRIRTFTDDEMTVKLGEPRKVGPSKVYPIACVVTQLYAGR